MLLARGEPSPGLGELARQYLTHLFGAYLADPGQPTRGGPGFLRWKQHPLRYLEGDLLRLGEPWTQLDRQRTHIPSPSLAPPPSSPSHSHSAASAGLEALSPGRPPRTVIVPRPAPIPPEALATLGMLLGRLPAPAAAAVQPPRSLEELRALHGPTMSEEELAHLARAEQRRWAYQQRKSQEQSDAETRHRTG